MPTFLIRVHSGIHITVGCQDSCSSETMRLTQGLLLLLMMASLAFGLNRKQFTIDRLSIVNVLKKIKPWSISCYTDFRYHNDSRFHKQIGMSIHEITNHTPTKIVDVTTLPASPNIQWEKTSLYNKNMTSYLHVIILLQTSSGEYVKNWIKLVRHIQTSFLYKSTTKVLILFFKQDLSDPHLKTMQKAVKKSGLYDLTVIEFYANQRASYVYGCWKYPEKATVGALNLFADKLGNYNAANMRIGLENPEGKSWRSLYMNNYGLQPYLNPKLYLYKLFLMFVYRYNVTAQIILVKGSLASDKLVSFFNLDVFLADVACPGPTNLDACYILFVEKIMAIVPIVYDYTIALSVIDIIVVVCIVAGLLYIAVLTLNYFEMYAIFTYLDMFKILLGLTVRTTLNYRGSKIIFFSIVVFSIFGGLDIICRLTKVHWESQPSPLVNDLADIFKHNISCCSWAQRGYLNIFRHDTPADIFKLLTTADTTCTNTSVIIISPHLIARKIVTVRTQNDKLRNWKIIDLNLPTFVVSPLFKAWSLERYMFSNLDDLIHESGIHLKWRSEFRILLHEPDIGNYVFIHQGHMLIVSLSVILSVGMIFALMCFAFEIRHSQKMVQF